MQLSRSQLSSDAVAHTVLEGLPPVMWYIRCQMKHSRSQGLTVPQYRALFYIARASSKTLSDIATHLGCTLPTTSRLIAGLIKKKFLTFERGSEDGRQKKYTLSSHGKKILLQSEKQTRQSLSVVFEKLSLRDQKIIQDSMLLLKSIFTAQKARHE